MVRRARQPRFVTDAMYWDVVNAYQTVRVKWHYWCVAVNNNGRATWQWQRLVDVSIVARLRSVDDRYGIGL